MIYSFMLMGYRTGWFGIPGSFKPGGQVHVVRNGKPICGQHIHPKAQFQWCADGINLNFIECKRCKLRASKRIEAQLRREDLEKHA